MTVQFKYFNFLKKKGEVVKTVTEASEETKHIF